MTPDPSKPAPQLHASWLEHLSDEFQKPYMQSLREFLVQEHAARRTIYPKGPDIFNALNLSVFSKTRVVVLGQDPYHGPGQAHGLSFSVPKGVPLPPSLQNIFKELSSDLNIQNTQGDLTPWAEQGVLLLNATLTVRRAQAGSHQQRGWEPFTDRIIQVLNERKEALVFILWGSYAKAKGAFVDRKRHCVLTAPHPSPLSAHRGFFGSQPFSQTNRFLEKTGQTPIRWGLS